MSTPTIEKRLQKRFIVMSTNAAMLEQIKAQADDQWQIVVVTDLEAIGEWNEVLLYRFIILDLDEVDAFDPLDVIRELRMQFQINIPVFCFGGDSTIQDEMRMSRADRFFTQNQMLEMIPEFCRQYAW